MTPRPFRPRAPRTPRRAKAAPAVAAAPVPASPWTAAVAPAPSVEQQIVDQQVASALTDRLLARCKAASLILGLPGEAIDLGTMLASGRHRTLALEPVLDGPRLHEMTARSPETPGGGFVVVEFAPVHGRKCATFAGPRGGPVGIRPCDCGAQAMFESLVLGGA